MIYCQNCGQQLDDNVRFCHNCGAQVMLPPPPPPPPPVYEQPPVQPRPPVYQEQYAYYQEPAPSISKAIVAMVLAGVAMFFSLVTFFSIFDMYSEDAFAMSIVMAMFVLPGGILGIKFGGSYLDSNAQNLKPLAKAAKIVGLVSILLLATATLISFTL